MHGWYSSNNGEKNGTISDCVVYMYYAYGFWTGYQTAIVLVVSMAMFTSCSIGSGDENMHGYLRHRVSLSFSLSLILFLSNFSHFSHIHSQASLRKKFDSSEKSDFNFIIMTHCPQLMSTHGSRCRNILMAKQ